MNHGSVPLSLPKVPVNKRGCSSYCFKTTIHVRITLSAAADGSSGSRWNDLVGMLRLSVNRRRMSDACTKMGSRSRESDES